MTGLVVHLTNDAGPGFTACGLTVSKLDAFTATTSDTPRGVNCRRCRNSDLYKSLTAAPVKAVDGALYHLKAWSSLGAPCGRRLAEFADADTEFWTGHVEKVNCPGCIASAEYRRALADADAELPPPVDMSLPAVQARRAGADMLHIYETLTRVNPRLSHVDAWHMAGNLYGDGLTISRPE